MAYTNFDHNAPYVAAPRDQAAYMSSASARMSPLTGLVGFHISAVAPEAMHVGPLGIFLQASGSVLAELSSEGRFL